MGWIWLIGTVAAGAGAYLVGWPAWTSYQSREARDLNTERYLAWRGRADRTGTSSTREGMTGEERRRLWMAAALAIAALACLVAFFTFA
jgi:drug/metabolite transporter (DMT)-like permease